MTDHPDIIGAKGAILIGPWLVVTLRDNRPDIPCPDMWDLPGGGREGEEEGFATFLRETREELGLDLAGHAPVWSRLFPSAHQQGAFTWFYVLRLPQSALAGVRMGSEGQGWRLVTPEAYRVLPDAVPYLRTRFFLWYDGVGLDLATKEPASCVSPRQGARAQPRPCGLTDKGLKT